MFVRNNGESVAFNADNEISKGLKELLFFYPGSLKPSDNDKTTFTPLLTLEKESGVTDWDKITFVPTETVQRIDPRSGRIVTVGEEKERSQITGEDLVRVKPDPETYLDEDRHVVAALLEGKGDSKVKAVFIADLDFVSELIHEQVEDLGQNLDNVTFLQNAIEVLAGDKEFVSLRNRRPTPRTLTYIEEETKTFRKERTKAQEDAEKQNRDELKEEQDKLDVEAKKIDEDKSLNFLEKLQRTSQSASDAQRRFDLKKRKFDQDLQLKIDQFKSREQKQIRTTENWVKWLTVLLAPLPAILLGVFVWFNRVGNERRMVTDDRRAD